MADVTRADQDVLGAEILARVSRCLDEHGLDVIVATSPENVAYASSAAPPSQRTVRSRLAAAIIPGSGETEVVAVALEGPVVRAQSRLERITLYEEFVQHPVDVIAASLADRGLGDGVVGVEKTHLSAADYERLGAALSKARLVPVDDLLAELRMIKTEAEIEVIRRIGKAAERVALECCAAIGAGVSERELANLIGERYTRAGGDALTMLVVGSGERSSAVNAPPTDRVLGHGDVLRLDIIGTSGHYYSDVARTAVVGKPTDEHARVYGLLMGVHLRALEMLRPGALTTDVYRIYREAMERAGLPPYHFVGHGLGITLHEDPFVNGLRTIALQPGMVLCIEPLTLIENRFGMQIEDEVLITDDGCELLTRAGELICIDA